MKAYLLCSFLFLPILMQGQTAPMLVDSAKLWSHVCITPSPGGPPPYTMISDHVRFGQDTLVNLHYYRRVLRASDQDHVLWSLCGWIREDAEHKVFYQSLTDTIERLLYDFSVQPGDTLYMLNGLTVNPVVDSVDSVNIGNSWRKRVWLGQEIWIEGIGSLCGVLQSGHAFLAGSMDVLLCYFENDSLKYSSPDYTECYYNNTGIIEDSKDEITLKIVPDPVAETSYIVINGLQDGQTVSLEIFSVTGSSLKTICINKQEPVLINHDDFTTGWYLYRLISPDFKPVTGKFVVN